MAPEVLIERHDRVLVISLNRPEVRNAIDGRSARGMAAALDQLDSSEDTAVGVLTGVGAAFCAGMDPNAFLAGDLPEVPGRGFGGLTAAPPPNRSSRPSKDGRWRAGSSSCWPVI